VQSGVNKLDRVAAMSDATSEKCVRSFGLVQAKRNTFQDEEGRAEHGAQFDKQVPASSLNSRPFVVTFTNTGTLEFGFCKPAQLPLDDRANRACDPSDAIAAPFAKKWWIDTSSCARAVGGRAGALLSKSIDRTAKKLYALFSLRWALGLWNGFRL
jgi:hypothetical protein